MFSLFTNKPLLDQGTTQWIFDSFAWAQRNFGRDLFYQQTPLVTPSDQFFPDQHPDPETLANLLLKRLQQYAGMEQWPCQAGPVSGQSDAESPPSINISESLRGPECKITVEGDQPIAIPYDPAVLRSPEMLLAGFIQNLAILLSRASRELPPGGEEYRGPSADLLAIFMGFGLFMANNAFSIRRGCSSCAPPSVQMMGDLTEEEMCYALALFCVLKEIETNEVLPHLKKSLRGFFKKAHKEICRQTDELTRLK